MSEMRNGPICPHCGYDLRHQQEIPYALPPGTMLQSKYLIGNVLGKGGFGITYVGFDIFLEVKVAIKEYYVSDCASRMGSQSQQIYWNANPGDINHFITEARRMAKLGEMPEIAHVRDIFYANNTAYIIMEYVEGVNLHTYLNNTKLMSYEQAVRLMLPVIEALGRVHKKGIVHRDISPDNLMVEREGTLRVLDLGAAGDLNRNNSQATQMVVRHGFSPYEQHIPTGVIGPYTDVYAVCATIYYCCTGKVIPGAIERMGRFMQTRKSELDMDPRIPPAGAKVLQKGLALEIKDRIPNMEELAEQLKKTLEQPKPVITVPKPPVIPKIEIKKPSFPKPESSEKKKQKEKTVQNEKTAPHIHPGLPKNKLPFLAGAGILAVVIGIAAFTETDPKPQEKVSEMSVIATEKQENSTSGARTAGSTEKTVKPLEIVKSLEMTDVDVGDTEKITVLSGHHSLDIKWNSSDPSIAEVSENGTVTVLNEGTVEVTATLENETVKCNVSISLRSNLAYTYETNSTGITITGYEGDVPAKLVLPSEIDGQKVTGIGKTYATAGAYLFHECTNLTDVIIPDGVTSIGMGLFADCTNLENVTIPDSVTEIHDFAFIGCASLKQIVIPPSVTRLEQGVFADCTSLKQIVIPSSVTQLDSGVFEGCTSLESITIPNSVTYISGSAFAGTPWLNGQTEEFVTFGDGMLIKYNGNAADVIIPSSVKSIPGDVFSGNTTLTSITIPGNVSEIGYSAFNGCENLETVNLAAGIEKLGSYAFKGCTKLKEVTIPDSVINIDMGAFFDCTSLTEINLPTAMTMICTETFSGCTNLKKIVISELVTVIGAKAFNGCHSLASVIFPEGLTEISIDAFRDCSSLKSITCPQSVKEIGSGAFLGCTNLKTAKLPESCELAPITLLMYNTPTETNKVSACFPDTCTLQYY